MQHPCVCFIFVMHFCEKNYLQKYYKRLWAEKLVSRTFWHSHSMFDARLCVWFPVLLWIVLWIHVCAVTLNKTGEQEFGDISGKLISPAASRRQGKRVSHTKALAHFCPLATFKFWTENYLQPLADSSWHTNTTHTHIHMSSTTPFSLCATVVVIISQPCFLHQ